MRDFDSLATDVFGAGLHRKRVQEKVVFLYVEYFVRLPVALSLLSHDSIETPTASHRLGFSGFCRLRPYFVVVTSRACSSLDKRLGKESNLFARCVY